MRTTPRAAVLAALPFVCTTGVLAAGRLFDFGPADSPVAEGFVRVTELDFYSAEKGLGWVRPIAKRPRVHLCGRSENFSKGREFLKLNPLLCDHVTGGRDFMYPQASYELKIDLPAGEYVAALIMGKMTERTGSTTNRPSFMYASYEVTANGKEVVRVNQDLWEYLTEFNRTNEDDFLPGDSLFDKFVAPYFHAHTFAFEGALSLKLSCVCPLNALLVFPKAEAAALRSAVADVWETSRTFLNSQHQQTEPKLERLDDGLKDAHRERGYLVFVRRHDGVLPTSRPVPSEVGRPTAAFVTPGELTTLPFCVLPLRELAGAEVVVTDLVSANDSRIPADAITPWREHYAVSGRVNRYHLYPSHALPLPDEGATLAANVCYGLRLYARVPAKTPSGDYQGEVKIVPTNAPAATLPVVIKVLPFELREPDMLFGMYGRHPAHTNFRFIKNQLSRGRGTFERLRRESRQLVERYFVLMRDLGFNTSSFTWPWHPAKIDQNGEVVTDPNIWPFWVDGMDTYKAIFGDRPLSIFCMGWTAFFGGRTTPKFDAYRPPKGFKGFSPEGAAQAEAMFRWFYREARERDWPEVILYVSDELSNYGVAGGRFGKEKAKLYQTIARKVGFRTCASMNGLPEHQMLPHVDIAIPNGGFPISDETVAEIRAAGCDLWFYNIGANRFSFGYYNTKSRPKGRLQWNFCGGIGAFDNGPSLPSLGSTRFAAILDSRMNVAIRSDLEQIRQGILDYRYYLTLEALVNANGNARDARLAAAVAKARKLLTKIRDGINTNIRHYSTVGVWTPKTCERLRWMLASSIMEIRNASKR